MDTAHDTSAYLKTGTNMGMGSRQTPQPLLCLIPVSPLPDFNGYDKIPSFVPARHNLRLFLPSQLLLLCEEVEVYAKTTCLGQGNTDLPVFPCYPSQAHGTENALALSREALQCPALCPPPGDCSHKSQNRMSPRRKQAGAPHTPQALSAAGRCSTAHYI